MLITILAFAFALGLLITFHELGHYSIARWCKVKILRFSIGFGPVLLQRTDKHGTQWAISAIPLGGYVKMLDEAPLDADESTRKSAFNSKNLGQRFAIVAAGPLANLLLAIIIYAFLGMWGSYEPAPILGQPASNTIAEKAGVLGGDRIIKIDDEPIQSWVDARWQITNGIIKGSDLLMQLEQNDHKLKQLKLDLKGIGLVSGEQDPLSLIGLSLYQADPYINEVQEGSAAMSAGLQPDDKIIAVNDVINPDVTEFIQLIQSNADQNLKLKVLRDGIELTVGLVPLATTLENGNTIGRIGAVIQAHRQEVLVKSGLLASVNTGFKRTVDLSIMSFRMLGHMLTGKASVKNISGPVTIAQYAGNSARIGIQSYLNFLALISISIGILNLLPIPMLDGGHLLFYLIEAIRGGKPVSVEIQEFSLKIGFAIVMGLTFLALFNDFERLFM